MKFVQSLRHRSDRRHRAATVSVLSLTAGAATETNWPHGEDLPGRGFPPKRICRKIGAPLRTSSGRLRLRAADTPRRSSGATKFFSRLRSKVDVPGARAVTHIDEGKEYLHPDSVGADRKHTFKVICLNRDTGKILWEQTAFEGTPYDNRHRKASFASSTPATDGKYVYAFFGTEGLFAYD